jgi:hypothetical protein
LVTEDEAARYLGVTPDGVWEFAEQDLLHIELIERPGEVEVMYRRREVLALKKRLGMQGGDDEWPDELT